MNNIINDTLHKIYNVLNGRGIRISGHRHGIQQMQAEDAAVIVPNDSNEFDPTSAFYVGADGNVTVQTASGSVVTFVGVLGGSIIPLRIVKVFATNTTATDIIALY